MTVLLALHDVTPFHMPRLERAEALFADLGVTRATYLVVPQFHGRWAIDRDPDFARWCARPRPFAVDWALHGWCHAETGGSGRFEPWNWLKRRTLTAGEGEFLSLAADETSRRVDVGTRMFASCLGVAPTAFVAPAWLFNAALVDVLAARGFRWTEDHRRIYQLQRGTTAAAPVITWATRTAMRRRGSAVLAPLLYRAWRRRAILRIAVHPFDFDDPLVVKSLRGVVTAALRERTMAGYLEDRAKRS